MKTGIKTVLLLVSSSVILSASQRVNLLTNGNFESGATTGWTLDVKKDDGADAIRMLDSSGTAKEGKIFHRTEVTAVPSDPAANNWHIQLKDPSYPVKTGYTYHLSMWAKADASQKIQFSVYGKNGDYLTSSAPFNLTTEWAQYHMVYKSGADGVNGINFAIVYGFEVGVYDIDDVIISETAADDNIYSNGGFELGKAGWSLNVNPDDSGEATMTLMQDSAYSGDNYCRINVTKVPTENWMIQLSDGTWTSEFDAEYNLSFWAKSDISSANIHIAVNAGSAKNYEYIKGSNYSLGSEWSEFVFTFIVTDSTLIGTDAVNFNVYCGSAVGNIDFDEFKLVKTNATSVRKLSVHSKNDVSHLKVNILSDRLQCNVNSNLKVSTVGVFNLQGKIFNLKQAGEVVNGNFILPRPPSGSWIIKASTDRSTISKLIVLP